MTEMSTRNRKNASGEKSAAGAGADNATAICELISWRMWDPQHLTTLQASTASYGEILLLLA
jgi:hypothetical protein